MKKGVVLILVLTLVSLFGLAVSAEPGDTESNKVVKFLAADEIYDPSGSAFTPEPDAAFVAAIAGTSFVFDNVSQGGRTLTIYYAAVGESAKLEVSLWNGSDYERIGRFSVPNSFGWGGESWTFASFYLEKSVPAGAKLKLAVEADPDYGVNLDYFRLGEARRMVEAEDKDGVVYIPTQAQDSKVYGVDRENTVNSSGEAHQSILADRYYLYGAIAECNRIVVAFAADNVYATYEVSYRLKENENWKIAGSIDLDSTGGWFTYEEFHLDLEVPIPEGATVRFRRTDGMDANVDYFLFQMAEPSTPSPEQPPTATPSEKPPATVTSQRPTPAVVDDSQPAPDNSDSLVLPLVICGILLAGVIAVVMIWVIRKKKR